MALTAPFNTKFGILTAYWMIASYRVDRIARTVIVQVAVFKDAETRAAHKAATAASIEAMAKIVELSKTAKAKRDAFADLSEAEKVKANPQLNVDLANLGFDISQLNLEMEKQRGIAAANLWGDVQEIAIPEGVIPIAADGSIELKAVYAHLAEHVVKGAEAA
jgi:hypothetical protein